jgi:PAS domain-containing protein
MAVPKDQAILAGILDKLLAELTPSEIADIQQRWVGDPLDERPFWRSLLLFGLPGLLAALLIIFSILRINHRLRSEMHSRALLESELRNSEQHYRGLVESLNAIAWQMDPSDFRFTYVAPQAERLLGYPIQDWLEPGFIERTLHPDDATHTLNYCRSETLAGRDHSMD